MIVGAALGGAAIQGLHAQAKLKAYSISELDVFNAEAQKAYVTGARKAIEGPMVAVYAPWDGLNT
jgi:hypothetical protein